MQNIEKELWCITTTAYGNDVMYLGWQNPAWDESGYFWTWEDVIPKLIQNNTKEYPFLFPSRRDAVEYLKFLKLPQRCKVVLWNP